MNLDDSVWMSLFPKFGVEVYETSGIYSLSREPNDLIIIWLDLGIVVVVLDFSYGLYNLEAFLSNVKAFILCNMKKESENHNPFQILQFRRKIRREDTI